MSTITDQLTLLAAHCQVAIDRSLPLILGLFLMGLVGSASHCAGMCGPFVLAQLGARAPAATGFGRVAGLALAPYHLGRGTTYVALGMVLAAPVGLMGALPDLRWLPAVMLALAAALFVIQAMRASGLIPVGKVAGAPVGLLGFARAFFMRPIGWRGYALGIVLGFLPCGLLYSALAAAAATGDPVAAGGGMLGFVLGTVPMLVTVGVIGHGAAAHWRRLAQKVLPAISAVNAIVLLVMAWRLSGFA